MKPTTASYSMTCVSCIHYSMHTCICTWQNLHPNSDTTAGLSPTLPCLQHYKMFLHAGFNITCRHSMTKPFWTSTCNTGHDEVSASARSFSAHKSKHNLSTYPLHLQEFGWYFRPLLSVYTGILRIEAQRNWRLKSSCQKSPDECSCYSWGDRNQLYWHCPALLVHATNLMVQRGFSSIYLQLQSTISLKNVLKRGSRINI